MPDVIVAALPERGLGTRGSEGEEDVFVEKLVADPRVKALDFGVLGWLTGSDEVKAYVALGGPLQQQMRVDLGTVVGSQKALVSAVSGNLVVERTYDARCREREVDLESECFASVVVDDRENASSAAAHKTATEKFDGPSLIGLCHLLQQGATLITDVPFSAARDEQSVRFVAAAEPLVVYDNSDATDSAWCRRPPAGVDVRRLGELSRAVHDGYFASLGLVSAIERAYAHDWGDFPGSAPSTSSKRCPPPHSPSPCT